MPNKKPEQQWSKPKGTLPNGRFPLPVHRGGITGGGETAARRRFRANGWYNNWRWPGISVYPHFHSTTHECRGVAIGWMAGPREICWVAVEIRCGGSTIE